MENKFINLTFLFLFFLFSISNIFLVKAAVDCSKVKVETSTPQELIECGSPDPIVPKKGGTSLYDIVMLINNTLAILATFFSIIGVIVGVIGLSRAQANKNAFEEAKGTIINSLLAFIITASIWIIVRLVFNTLGIGALNP